MMENLFNVLNLLIKYGLNMEILNNILFGKCTIDKSCIRLIYHIKESRTHFNTLFFIY